MKENNKDRDSQTQFFDRPLHYILKD